MEKRYDIAFLGGGPAGYQGAIRAAQLGASVAVIEKNLLGGVCLNRGCIPTKAMRASAETAGVMRRAREYGFQPVDILPDMASVIARRERILAGLRGGIEQLFSLNSIDVIKGNGRFVSSGHLEVENEGKIKAVEAEKIVIATGSRPASLPGFNRSEGLYLSEEILNMSSLPGSLLIAGGGAIGVEMAAIFRQLGSEVTLVEDKSRLLPSEDAEMGEYLQSLLRRRGIKVICGEKIKSCEREGDKFNAQLSGGVSFTPDAVLLAVGRLYNTEGIGLKEIGVRLEGTQIKTDEHMQTNIPGIYAAGDVVGEWPLAHVAFAEGICAAESALGRESSMDYRVVPRTVFCIPEYAAVGLSEEDAGKKDKIKVARFPFKSLGMGQAAGEIEGLVKIISHFETNQILGAYIIGAHASDMLSEITLAMQAKIPSGVIMNTIHTHPTLSEAVLETVQSLHGKAIHIPPR